MRENKVAVIVVTYNRKRLLERCINTLCAQTVRPWKIFIVDNASNDGTETFIEKYMHQYADLIAYHKMPENLGGSGGFSYGFQWADQIGGWDWLMVMDDDAAPASVYIEKLLNASEKYPRIKGFIGTEYVGDTEKIAYGGRRVIDKESTLRTVIVPKDWYQKESFTVDTVTFVGLMIHKSIVDKAGVPDASFFIYYDDSDYCFKMRPYTKILHVVGARIVHREDYEKDVVIEGKQEWRQFYLYRNEVAIKKRYISRWYIKLGWIFKNYGIKVMEIIKSDQSKCRSIWLVTRATWDVLLNKMGKVKYLNEAPK